MLAAWMRALPQLVFPKRSSAVAAALPSTRVCDGSWRSVTTALHRRAANCVLFGTKWNAEFA
jgi:hypothetical protein